MANNRFVVRLSAFLMALLGGLLAAGCQPTTWSQSERRHPWPKIIGDGLLGRPTGIAVNSSGEMFVADSGSHQVRVFAPDGTLLRSWGGEGTARGRFIRPMGIALGPNGCVYVTDYGNDRVQVFNRDGAFLRSWGTTGSSAGQFDAPAGIDVDGHGNVYIADFNNHRIQKFNSAGRFLKAWGRQGHGGGGELYYPTRVEIGPKGNIYIADAYNNRVQKFTSGGKFLTLWPKGDGNSKQASFNVSSGIAVDKSDRIWVADFFGSRLEVFTADGTLLWVFDGKGREANGFKWPIDLAFDGDGTLYVVDYGNNRIQKYRNPQPVAIPIKTATRVDSSSRWLDFPSDLRAPAAHKLGKDTSHILLRPDRSVVAWGDPRLPDPDAGLNTNVALTPPAGGTIVRTQWRFSQFSDDPTPMNREVTISTFPTTVIYGLTEDLAVLGTVHVVHRRTRIGATGQTIENDGVADIPLQLKWRVWEKDELLKTTRFALLGGLEVPSYDRNFSSRSFDPITGVVWTYQEKDWWLDWDVIYQLNTGRGEFRHDALKYDIAYSRRLLPLEIPTKQPWALYGVLELNGSYTADGSHRVFGSPGIQMITPQVILEAGVQLPMVQKLNGNQLKRDFTLVLSLRFQF